MPELKLLVIHCTATREGKEVTAKMIRDWHTSPKPTGRGWKQVGYADIIHLNGMVENLVPYNEDDKVDAWEITNGVAGVNYMARHVVYAGGMDDDAKHSKDTRTKEQSIALRNYINTAIAQHPDIKVAGHNQFDSGKACPSFDVSVWLKAIGVNEKNIYRG
jgi:N-acetylmuramoyl-L-alanine amidase